MIEGLIIWCVFFFIIAAVAILFGWMKVKECEQKEAESKHKDNIIFKLNKEINLQKIEIEYYTKEKL